MVKYFNGDLLKSGCNIICHQVNTLGVMGAGIALQIKNRYPECFQYYNNICTKYKDAQEELIGGLQLWASEYSNSPTIANFFSQKGLGKNVQTDYNAFRTCCQKLKYDINIYYKPSKIRIGFPYKIGCGLARGNWDIVKQIIEEEFADDIWNVEIWRYNK